MNIIDNTRTVEYKGPICLMTKIQKNYFLNWENIGQWKKNHFSKGKRRKVYRKTERKNS